MRRRTQDFRSLLVFFELSEKSLVVDLECFSSVSFIAPAGGEDMFDLQDSCRTIFSPALQC